MLLRHFFYVSKKCLKEVGVMRRKSFPAVALLSIFLFSFGCNDNGTITNPKIGPLPPDPNDWVCPDSVIDLSQAEIDAWCMDHPDRGLPAPPDLRVPPPFTTQNAKNVFDTNFREFLRNRLYATDLNWMHDMNWRMTGPYVGAIGFGEFYGVHSTAVRIHYSPEIIDWLCSGRQGIIPDGAMIIKEQHPINESLGISVDSQGCMDIMEDVEPTHWTVFVKNIQASNDGWYQGSFTQEPMPPVAEWEKGNPPIFDRSAITDDDFFNATMNPPTDRDPNWYPTGYLFLDDTKLPDVVWSYNQYGNWCLNCHASAEKESTFSSLVNVITSGTKFKQFSPDLLLLQDPDFRGDLHAPQRIALFFLETQNEKGFASPFTDPLSSPTTEFLTFYDQMAPVPFEKAWEVRLPAETYDHQVSLAGGPGQFLTADQCIGCHDATFMNSTLPNMIFQEKKKDGSTKRYNLSPYAEWKASPLGQAGRDPIFFAQVQSETNFFADTGLANLPDPAACIETTCLHCHGVMGQRQYQIDTKGQDEEGCPGLFGIPPLPEVPLGKPFRASAVTQWPGSEPNTDQQYGSLARDGISCTVCHHMVDTAFNTEAGYTGNFVTGPGNQIFGPYGQIVHKPMENSLGINPLFGQQTLDSQLCGTCHNILLPMVTNQGVLKGFSYEQTTHLEWLNSDYAPGKSAYLSCQDCHMPKSFDGKALSTKIANIETNEFAPTSNRLPDEEITLKNRNSYARHPLHGLNVFLNEMFQESPLILGRRQIDFMSGIATTLPLTTARNSFLEMAKNQTASVDITTLEKTADGKLRAALKVTNKAGHYLPSGVGFRRVFIEFLVRDKDNNILWASGRTNSLGAIIEGVDGPVLPSELPIQNPKTFLPHYQIIGSQDEVQIYQELITDSDGNLTTSFLRRITPVKNNRIRPKGFDPAFFAENPSQYISELAKIPGEAKNDPYYTDPTLTGADKIEYLVSLDAATMAKADNVKVTLFNQSIPPFYLQQRFRDASIGAAQKDQIERLYYLTSHLNTSGAKDDDKEAFIKDWKLMVATDNRYIQ
jgi:hypothetical protein